MPVIDTLHMDTEGVSSCVTHFRAEGENIRQQAQVLAVLARSVNWYGPSRDEFQYELEQIAMALTRLADQCDVLAARAQREANEWQETDAYFSLQFSQLIYPNVVQKG